MRNPLPFNYYPFLCTLGVLAVLLLAGCTASKKLSGKGMFHAGGSIDCSSYGNAPFLFWNTLTGIEIATLLKADSAKIGNPEALLALALFASGNIRDSGTYLLYSSRVRSFVENNRQSLDAITDPKERGRALYSSLCREFYHESFMRGELSGYRAQQSQLSELLRTQKYNCISSALLCMIVFRFFNLDVQGVIMPSHAFIQYTTSAGKRIEIETTTKEGYDFKHDDAYFKGASADWAVARNLPVVTREMYAQRQAVTPFRTVCYNMSNQHVETGRMPLCDQERLSEASGYLLPDDMTWESNRLASYNNQYVRFDSLREYGTAMRMFEKIGPSIVPMLTRWQQEPDMMDNLSLIWCDWMVTLVKKHRYAEALGKADTLLSAFSKKGRYYISCRTNVSCALAEIGFDLIQQKKFLEAGTLYDRYRERLRDVQQIDENYRYLHEVMAGAMFNEKNFQGAIAGYEAALSFAVRPEDKKRNRANIEAAYLNLERTAVMDNNKTEAVRVLKECIEKCPLCQKCKTRLDSMK